MNNKGLQLVWNGKEKIINHHNEIPFRILNEIKDKSYKKDDSNTTDNILIRGDNLEGLKALKPYFYNSIRMIYIDPPYNTGAKQGSFGWVYSDRVDSPLMKKWFNKVVGAEHEDYSRHTKWLCMMYPRLKLLWELLKEEGVIFISIDDNEVHHLRCLMDEIFGAENFVVDFIWKKKGGASNTEKLIGNITEHIICYCKNKGLVKFNKRELEPDEYPYSDEEGHYRLKGPLLKTHRGEYKRDTMTFTMEIDGEK